MVIGYRRIIIVDAAKRHALGYVRVDAGEDRYAVFSFDRLVPNKSDSIMEAIDEHSAELYGQAISISEARDWLQSDAAGECVEWNGSRFVARGAWTE